MYEDSGCNRCVAGKEVHKKWQRYLAEFGLQAVKLEKTEEFVFGNGQVEMSDCAYSYPIFLGGEFKGSIDIARINADCPPLFSKKMMKEWKITLDFEQQCTLIKQFDITSPFHGSVPVIDVLDIPENFKIQDVPSYFRRSTTPSSASSLCYAVNGKLPSPGTVGEAIDAIAAAAEITPADMVYPESENNAADDHCRGTSQ